MASDFLNIELCTSNKNYVIGLCGFSEWVKCLVPATQWTINISCQYSKTFVFSNASGSEISLILSYHISDLFVSFRDDHGAWAMCIRIIFYCVRDRGEEESSFGLWQIIFCEPGVCSHYSSFVQSPAQSLLQLCEVMFEAWGDGQLGPHPGNYSLHRDRLYFFTYFSPIAIHSTKKKKDDLWAGPITSSSAWKEGDSLWSLYPGPFAPLKKIVLCLFCHISFVYSLLFC